jgi:hypothetical protein
MNLIELWWRAWTAPWSAASAWMEAVRQSGAIQADAWDYAPVTTWFSPNVTIYAGDPKIEERIFRAIASPGRQLGKLTDAVLELASGRSDGPAIAELRGLASAVEYVKAQSKTPG